MVEAFEGQREGEEAILIFRRAFSGVAKTSLLVILLVALTSLSCVIWPENSYCYALVAFVALVGLLMIIRRWILWHYSYYLLTNDRLRQVRQKGMFKRTVVDLDLRRIMSVSYGVSGLLGNILNYGTILIQTAAGDLVLSKIKHPAEIHDALQDAMHVAIKDLGDDEKD